MRELIFYDKLKENIPTGDFAVIDERVNTVYGKDLRFRHKFVFKASESNKSLSKVEEIADFLADNGVNRSSALYAIGGGVTLDTAGFVAAIYMRGIDWIAVPTTLLAQSDSAVGGKTGINLGSKNTLGAFHLPRKILFYKEFLNSLNIDELKSGLGEIIKTALLNENIFKFVKANFNELLSGNIERSYEVAKLCALYKDEICKKDFYDISLRTNLNLGHTVGHSIESLYGISHGKSVIWGLKTECEMFSEFIEPSFFSEIKELFDEFLKGETLPKIDCDKLLDKMIRDKKNSDGITFIIPVSLSKTQKKEITLDEARDRINAYFTDDRI